MNGALNWRTCKCCGLKFDIATNFDCCPECRKKISLGKRRVNMFFKGDTWRKIR